MRRRKWFNAFAVGVFALALLVGFADLAAARGRRGHRHHRHYRYHAYYPFWRFHYYDYPFRFYYGEPYGYSAYYRVPNFRLAGFLHYPGAIGKGEITPRDSGGKAVSQEILLK